jgi:SpoVK/Ycf46/Vps4 family AAA+-type ATPase
VPLLRLDFGTLYNKYHGETERNLRESLQSAAVMAPCVLWIDEIEKGISQDAHDGGTSRRVLGSLLTWMAEKKAAVFLVATANDISTLPPELIRKGRLDEIFFVDLPEHATRMDILSIHLGKRDQDPGRFDLDQLALATRGFTGAEIEQTVVSALYRARDHRIEDRHILEEIRSTRPISVLMAEQIAALRKWAKERTVPAE